MRTIRKFLIHTIMIVPPLIEIITPAYGQELPSFKAESFKKVITNDMTEPQKESVFSQVSDYFPSFYLNKEDAIRLIGEDELIPSPGDYFVEFKNDNHHYKGVVEFCYRPSTMEYVFKMYILKDQASNLKITYSRGKPVYTPNIKDEENDTVFTFSDGSNYREKFKLLAGTAVCSYREKTPEILNLESFSLFPYKFSHSCMDKVCFNKEELAYEGIVRDNVQTRLNAVYNFVGCFAAEIAQVERVVLNNREANLSPLILQGLTTKGTDNISYIQNKQHPHLYELAIKENISSEGERGSDRE